MKISELIKELQVTLEEQGDLIVCVDYDEVEFENFELSDDMFNIPVISKLM